MEAERVGFGHVEGVVGTEAEVIGVSQRPTDDGDDRPLLAELVRDGVVVGGEPLAVARDRHRAALGELPAEAHQLQRGEPAIPTQYEGV